MKQLFKPLLTALLLLCSIVVNAHDFEVDGIYYNILSEEDKTVEVTFRGDYYNTFDEYIGAVVIPKEVSYKGGSYKVTSIKSSAFGGCKSLTSITIPNSFTSIGYHAFWGCSGLTSITIPNSVTSIGSSTFEGCSSLTSIVVDEENTVYDSRNNCNAIIETASNTLIAGCKNTIIPEGVTSIGNRAFSCCSDLTSITIPNSVTSIGSCAFVSCSSLTSITIPNSVTSIGSSAFHGCSSLTSIIIPNSVTSIGNGAFSLCSNLTSIAIPNSITSIGSGAFEECSSLTSIAIPNSVTNIGDIAFSGCSSLTSIAIPNSVTSIGYGAFYGCSSLTNTIIPNSVTSIGDYTFGDCTSLTSIDIPNSVTNIGDYAFYECSGLTSIIIPNSVTSIGNYAFDNCSLLKELHIEDGTQTLTLGYNDYSDYGEGLFYDCPLEKLYLGRNLSYNDEAQYGHSPFNNIKTLATVTIGNSVTRIGHYGFASCSSLKEVINFSNLTFSKGSYNYGFIAYYANKVINAPNGTIVNDFVFCTQNEKNRLSGYLGNEKEITLPENYKGEDYYIGEYSFENCDSLTSVTIPNSVTSIGSSAFYNCSGLTSIIIPNSVTSIGSSTFEGCSSLTSIAIPNSVTSIGDYVFNGCSSLTSITIPNSVTSIGIYAFKNCTSLKEVHINDLSAWCKIDFSTHYSNPLYFAKNLFLNGNKVSEVIIPDDITEIKEYAFYDCDSLTSIIIPNSVTSIERSAFYGCSGLTSITIPDSVTSIGVRAFEYCTNLEKLYLGNSIESIGYEAFYGCNSLLEIYASSNKAIECHESVFSRDAYNNACLFVPTGRKFTYEKTTPWSNFYIVEMEFSDSYQLIYMVDGEIYKSFNLNYGAIIEPVAEPTKEGHTFSGWSDIPRTMPAKTVIVNGSFTPNSYTVTFKVDGAEYKVLSVVYGTAIPTIEAPTKEGHTFSGWSEIPEPMPAKDIVVEGSFTINSYTLTYKVDGAVYKTETVVYGTAITPIAAPTKEGYTFSGWSEIPETMPAKDIVVEGSFSINSYTLTYKVDGEVYKTETVEYGATIEPIEEPTKEGYTFSGWKGIPATMPAKEVIVEGSFSINSYTLTYKVDGEVYATDSIKFGATIEPIAEPTKEGHTFSGWKDIPATMPAEDIVVEGSFTINSYTLTYKVDGAVYKTETVVYGTAITPIAEPIKEGHTFSGWSEIPATMPANDVIIEGTFSVNSYTVTFMVDGEIYETMTVEYGAEIELPTPPEKEGYIFTGWIGVPATMPAEDIVIEGRFEVDTTGINAVTLDLEKNEVYNLKGQRITESENLTRGIYIVNGKKIFIK